MMIYKGQEVRDCNCFNGSDHAPDCNFIIDTDAIENEQPEVDDSVKCCPNCETPNQFGETCYSCEQEAQADYEDSKQ